ncbi:MAG: hypothetical protein VKJ24_06175 [Synechococcales bacterium]|nr:hypothetical protein [Synechococcales bacterium]
MQTGEPYWMPELGLGIGRHPGNIGGFAQEILTWFDANGDRYLSAEERAERLEAYLRSQGIDPNQLLE